jgi:hypothetical protein
VAPTVLDAPRVREIGFGFTTHGTLVVAEWGEIRSTLMFAAFAAFGQTGPQQGRVAERKASCRSTSPVGRLAISARSERLRWSFLNAHFASRGLPCENEQAILDTCQVSNGRGHQGSQRAARVH